MKTSQRCAMFFLILWTSWAVEAAIKTPLREPTDLKNPKVETVEAIKGASVILADYDLIRHDFVFLSQYTDRQVDQWILSRTAYVSVPQTSQVVVNTPIELKGERIDAFRPDDYNRSMVFSAGGPTDQVEKVGLIDAKGTGTPWVPSQGDHTNGLAALAEVMREYSIEKMAAMVLRHARSDHSTIGSYAVLDLGFDVINRDGSTTPAGMILRQAHTRCPGYCSLMDDATSLRIESLYRFR